MLTSSLFFIEVGSGFMAGNPLTKAQVYVEPAKSYGTAQYTVFVVTPGFLGNARWVVKVLAKAGLNNYGWLVAIDADPKGGYDDYTLAEKIEQAVREIELQIERPAKIIGVAESQGAFALTT